MGELTNTNKAPENVPARPSSSSERGERNEADAARKQVESNTQKDLEGVADKTKPQQLQTLEDQMKQAVAKSGVESAVSTAAGAVTGSVDKIIPMFEKLVEKFDYYKNQLASVIAPFVSRLPSFKIFGWDAFAAPIEGFFGKDNLMIITALRSAGLKPVFNPVKPDADTAAIERTVRAANAAKAHNRTLTNKDFYSDAATLLTRRKISSVALTTMEEMAVAAEETSELIKKEKPTAAPAVVASNPSETPTTTPPTTPEVASTEDSTEEIPVQENPSEQSAPINIQPLDTIVLQQMDGSVSVQIQDKRYSVAKHRDEDGTLMINGKKWKLVYDGMFDIKQNIEKIGASTSGKLLFKVEGQDTGELSNDKLKELAKNVDANTKYPFKFTNKEGDVLDLYFQPVA